MPALTTPAVAFLIDYIEGKVADDVLRRLMHGRREAARDSLAAKMARGKPWLASEDDTAAALFTYVRAAQEGAARLNLRLMAEAMTNAAQEPTFAPDVFRHHAAVLAGLSRDEVRLLAAFARENRTAAAEPDDPTDAFKRVALVWTRLLNDTASGLEVTALAGALTRTGWLVTYSGFGGLVYATSRAFEDVVRLVDFEAELAELSVPPADAESVRPR